jgi:hypothetical protein
MIAAMHGIASLKGILAGLWRALFASVFVSSSAMAWLKQANPLR